MARPWWETFFDDDYLATYRSFKTDEEAQAEAEAIAALLALRPGAAVLDAPCGYGRISLPLARLGCAVTGVDLSDVQLVEARRAAEGVAGLELVRGDLLALPLPDAAFDAALNYFTSIGYFGDEGDQQVLRELHRVLRPGGRLLVETMHRDRLVSIFVPRTWNRLPDGGLFLQERELDAATGIVREAHLRVGPDGERSERRFESRVYAVPELVRMVEAAGFAGVACYGGLDGRPVGRDTRLVIVARA
jgi:SAM-dependent methyltransferase